MTGAVRETNPRWMGPVELACGLSLLFVLLLAGCQPAYAAQLAYVLPHDVWNTAAVDAFDCGTHVKPPVLHAADDPKRITITLDGDDAAIQCATRAILNAREAALTCGRVDGGCQP